MDELTDTEMSERCTDASPKEPKTYGVYRYSQSPHDIWEMYSIGEHTDVQGGYEAIWTYGGVDVWGFIDLQGVYGCPLC